MIFEKIFIFDILTEEAFVTSFDKGVNIITSSSVDGTDRGKSVLLRSLYHVLGADSHFDKKWKNQNKVYLLEFLVEKRKYYIYRHQKLFKAFDKDINIIFQTFSRTELADFLGDIWSFKIFLPNRDTKMLELAPPAYTYVMNFIDQDFYDGTKFNSFRNLGQYRNFKPDVIYSHLGVYNKQYFERIKNKQNLLEEIAQSESEYSKVNEMKIKISGLIGNIIVPENIEELENELCIKSKEYNTLLDSMNEIRYKLTNFRNEKYELEVAISQIEKYRETKEQEINSIFMNSTCPECHTVLSNTIDLRSKRYNSIEDSIYIKDSIFIAMKKVEQNIIQLENQYRYLSNKMQSYKNNINSTKDEIDNYASYKGLNDLYNSLNRDMYTEYHNQLKLKDKVEDIDEELKTVGEEKSDINKKYHALINEMVLKFGLNELEDSQYKSIHRVFCASGSNKPISTVIWYFSLNNLKKGINANSVFLPMVLDSPKNAEMDEDKEQALIKYILEGASNYAQLIFSSIGFKQGDFHFYGNLKIIELNNDKYQLLDKKSYMEHQPLLEWVLNAQLI
ncbi:hypothetical protein [Aerococcus urinaehominis]|uniref:hypothetical protein n=1 Tax=Aerococcus urinaehominis TaxID=128944 RepID=UPI001F2E0FB9|nr:hypothetical protein [Aerococcus urinaehominis]